jgi:LemA protein
MISEGYPELKASDSFLNLQSELSNSESRVSYARNYYNESVQIYNTKITSFPTNLYAKMQKARQREFFVTDEAARAVPKVQF